MEIGDTGTLLSVLVGIGLSAAAGLRLFVPLLVASAASLSGHLELASQFDWIGSYPALIAFAAASVLELGAYLVPLLDNALDWLAAPVAAVAGTVLTASSIVEMSPFLKWTLAIVAGGGVAGTVHALTAVTRLGSTTTTGGLANPGVAAAELTGSVGVSLLAIAAPVLAAAVVVLLIYLLLRVARKVRRGHERLPRFLRR
ncbi:MAG: DUF4126 domain-containing protein [Actinomycetota bacterium]|nr:DUF4126 domain-containing protein [Actinomycetota bacterium]